MKSLTLGSTQSVSDKALRGISAAFPNLTRLDVNAAAGSAAAPAFAHLQKLRHLQTLNVAGNAVDAPSLSHLVMLEQLTHLGIGAATVPDTEVRLLAKLASLHEMEWTNPPVSDVALKGYARLHGLTQFKVGTTAKPEVLDKIGTAMPWAKITQ